MGSYPDDVFGGIIIESLDVVMGNTVGTVTVESDICHHLDFFAFFAVLEQLLAFPVGRVEEADSVLGGHYQLVLIRHDVADDVGRQGFRIVCFHAVVCESA